MADREESISVTIHLDIDPEDDDKIRSLAGKTDRADAEGVLPTDDVKDNTEQIESFLAGNVGQFQNFTTKQFNNIKSMASNPTMFMLTAFMRKFVGAGIAIGLALLFWDIVTWILEESFKAGRWLDRRFRRVAQEEIMGWWDRKTQEELRHGFQDVRVTTQQGLRGGMGQVNGNLFQFSSVTGMFQSSPYKSSEAVISNWSAKSQPATTPQGNIRTTGGRFK